ncbi:MAG TPA: PKD domain-containing protein, partial [Candidatus Acidoferrum sp.]
MRKWCATVAVSALLALPMRAQQAPQNDDAASAAAASASAEKGPAKVTAGDITPASRNLFALPESPRPKPFPADAKSSGDTPPGKLVPKFEIAGMFNYVNFDPGGGFNNFNAFGGSGAFTWNASRWIGFTEELGGLSYDRNVNGSTIHGGTTTFLLGPRLNLRKFDYFVPFAEFLLGGSHAGPPMTGAGSQTAFALAAGGGVDIALTRNIVWRFAEIDYFMTNFSGPSVGGNSRQDNVRFGSGIVLRFGLPHEAPPPTVNHPPVAACTANPTSIFAGSSDVVAVHVDASDPDNDPLTYSYAASGGTVDGSGPDARWSAGSVAPGSYTVTATVNDGKGGTASCATDIRV